MTHLLKIEGKFATRYSGSKRVDKVELDVEDLTPAQVRWEYENFRKNGFTDHEPTAAELAFDRIEKTLERGDIVLQRPIEE